MYCSTCRSSRAGDDADRNLSDADLLLRFARTARPLDQRAGPGFFLEELDARAAGMRLFRLSHKWAAEFVLRKDYRGDWDVELLEEYTYFTADEFVDGTDPGRRTAALRRALLEPLDRQRTASWAGSVSRRSGTQLGWPATNFVAVAQRARPGRRALDWSNVAPSDNRGRHFLTDAMRDTSMPNSAGLRSRQPAQSGLRSSFRGA